MKYYLDSKIRFSETDSSGALSLPGLINYFQDCATFQSESLGIGYDYLAKKGQAWVITAWQIVIDRMPRLYENIRAATWAYGFRACFGLRNFTLEDEAGNICVWANSEWVLFDIEKQQPVRVPKDEAEAYEAEERWEMEYAPRKIRMEKDSGQVLDSFQVIRHHLDRNMHVNNGQYISMAEVYLPENFKVRQLRAEYKAQARLGDQIIVKRCLPKADPSRTYDDLICIGLEDPEGKAYAVVEFAGNTKVRE